MASEAVEVTDAPAAVEPPQDPANETPEQIEARLLQRQQAIAGRLDVLEQQTLGSIRDTIGSVTDTVNTVQAVVSDPVKAVQSAVMNPLGDIAGGVTNQVSDMLDKFNPTEVIRRHPFESVGVAVAGGVVVGMMLSSRTPVGGVAAAGGSSLLQAVLSPFRDELANLGRQLFDTVSQSLVERVKGAVSGFPTPAPPPPAGGR